MDVSGSRRRQQADAMIIANFWLAVLFWAAISNMEMVPRFQMEPLKGVIALVGFSVIATWIWAAVRSFKLRVFERPGIKFLSFLWLAIPGFATFYISLAVCLM
jgi:hypothetical protein